MRQCTEAEVNDGTHTRIQLNVPANTGAGCTSNSVDADGFVELKCNLRDTGFGNTSPNFNAAGGDHIKDCSPWIGVGFYNRRTGQGIPVKYIKHWSWRTTDRLVR